MYFNEHWQIRTKKKKPNEFELTPLVESVEKPLRRIYRCPTNEKESAANYNIWKLEDSNPKFGPLYKQTYVHEVIRTRAWEHVLKHMSSTVRQEVTMETYTNAIRKVEQQAKQIYDDKNISGSGSDFRWLMIKDGCFFLQLALVILGCSDQLKYPPNHPLYTNRYEKKRFKNWTKAMFYVGNQIPLVVLKELMKQKFFQDIIIARGKSWDMDPQSGLCKNVLFEMLVSPALKTVWPTPPRLSLKERIMGKSGNKIVDEPPCDILHGLQKLMIGPGQISVNYKADDDMDLEANNEDFGDYVRFFPSTTEAGDGSTPSQEDVEDKKKRLFPSATELKRAGIMIWKLNSGGARSISFKSYYFVAFLCLPAFLIVDDDTEMILHYLKIYESRQLAKHKREASAYLRFMSDLVQSSKDLKLLEKKGVIQRISDDSVEKLPGILSRLKSEDMRFTHEYLILRRKIRDYTSPWTSYKGVINVVVFLTLLQTFFALLAYFKPPKS